ncbi:MAG: efflux RND transporter periplasmic adaptor subunit [Bacteroidota bacterium]|nr:efflux RND transporter periplasmic adaptor subunit [Bacteroidota bacterium]
MKLKAKYFITIVLAIAIAFITSVSRAHEGHDHAPPKKNTTAATGSADQISISKESQFLLNIRTTLSVDTLFKNTLKLLGTVKPTTSGSAVISVPQNARITSIIVKVGQKVKKGEVIATAEQNLAASEQLDIQAQRAVVNAEVESARRDYERLKSLGDIVARKELQQAEIRYKGAIAAQKVFNNSQSVRSITLRSPINGTVDNFVLSPGAQVEPGEELFRIIDLNKVWVEAQVFEKDMEKVENFTSLRVESLQEEFSTAQVRIVSTGKILDSENQSLTVILEIDNSSEHFKIGQFVTAYASFGAARSSLTVPNEAISDLNGKAVVFTHLTPETFQMHEVLTGATNGSETVIESGLTEGERVVVTGTYQVKSIYLNQ